MADSKVADLTEATTLSNGDLFYVVRDPAGTPVDRKIKKENLISAIGKRASVIRLNGSNYTTTSTSLTAIDDTNLPLTLTLAVGDVVELLIQFGITNSGGSVTGIDWLIDRPTSSDITSLADYLTSGAWAIRAIQLGTNGNDGQGMPTIAYFTATEAGAHIFKPRWKVSGSTSAIQQTGSTYPQPIIHSVKVI